MKEQTYTFKDGDLLTILINGNRNLFIIENAQTDFGTPVLKGVSIDGSTTFEITHSKKVNITTVTPL